MAVSAPGTYAGIVDCVRKIVAGEGAVALYQGLGTSLVELSLARCGAVRPAEVGACLPALSGLRRLDLAGLQLAEVDHVVVYL